MNTTGRDIRPLIFAWAIAASASGIWAFVQFWTKRQRALAAGEDFYLAYVADRATGFMGHWMTFGAAQMSALMLVAALLCLLRLDVIGGLPLPVRLSYWHPL